MAEKQQPEVVPQYTQQPEPYPQYTQPSGAYIQYPQQAVLTPQYEQQPGVMPQYTQQPGVEHAQQPRAGPQMTLNAGGNRNALNKPYDRDNERDWSHSIFSCFGDCGTCCVAWFCPCIVWSRNKSRLEHLERNGTPHPDGGEAFGGDCALYGLLSFCGGWGWVLQLGTRASIRERYRIKGSAFSDCFSSWCCHPCDLTQESREIELEERNMPGPKPILA